MSIKGVVVARPLNESDPIFIGGEGNYLFPKVIQRLVRTGLIHDPVICLPEATPSRLRAIIDGWPIDCFFSPDNLPQHRLAGLLEHDDSSSYFILSGYSYLLFEEALTMGLDAFSRGNTDLVCIKDIPAYSYFGLASRRCLQEIGAIQDIAVTPFVLKKYAPDSLNVTQLTLQDNWFRTFNFLTKTLYYGDGGNVPDKPILDYHGSTPQDDLFTRSSYSDWLAREFFISDIDGFARELPNVLPADEITRAAAKVHFLKRLLPHLPEKRQHFLEIGFGAQPLSSILLLNAFEQGTALEPYATYDIPWGLAQTLSRHVGSIYGLDLGRTRDTADLCSQLSVSDKFVHDLDAPDGSMDFIFSKTVLEHVMDAESFSRNLYDLLAPGGVMFHIIDHSDHVDVKTIRFDFLEHDPTTWASMQGYTNLMRVNDFVDLWQRIGFEVEIVERHGQTNWTKPVHPHWDSYSREDLFCYSSTLVATKPGA